MNIKTTLLFLVFAGINLNAQNTGLSATEKVVVQHIDKNKAQYEKTSLAIWELAELGFQEDKSTLLLQNLLKEK